MVDVTAAPTAREVEGAGPQRLHHLAYTTYDMEATRQFYEEQVGMPLTQCWVEAPNDGPLAGRQYVHCFYTLKDGGAIAYFEHLGVEKPTDRPASGFHIAFKVTQEIQNEIRQNLVQAGHDEDDIRLTDHGYCLSLYVHDPNGLTLEFTVDCDEIDKIVAYQAENCHAELRRWQSGDHTPNNSWRPDGE